ncbi:hypothetical protein BCR41DRAFT_372427 [Lobosporangium transversale]|uniref:Uncharacterized protein n=1 Tax=Lobosporangium transversale TaxID=64571 RepID=A0A1Y2GH60_9FUNG|nr:hypothetical protein BCR41DRAFT_372427 [Lobosporangium transversale]ORZ10685.1 hypothetical protein BCR41DRAFT_372427 [Lobosporangium transversale]|eukprot:XP_021879406.1 hypothetical protein BCR41DRAFT_372427 [Lobosporangium transversale]
MSNGLHLQPAGRCRLDGGLGPATGVSVDCSRVYGPGGTQPDHLHVVRPGLSASRQAGEESESKSLSQGQHAVLVWGSPFSAHFLRPAELCIELVVLSRLSCLGKCATKLKHVHSNHQSNSLLQNDQTLFRPFHHNNMHNKNWSSYKYSSQIGLIFNQVISYVFYSSKPELNAGADYSRIYNTTLLKFIHNSFISFNI